MCRGRCEGVDYFAALTEQMWIVGVWSVLAGGKVHMLKTLYTLQAFALNSTCDAPHALET